MDRLGLGWGYWAILFWAITGHAAVNAKDSLEPVSKGLWGVPLSVPATWRGLEVSHKKDDGVSDQVTEEVLQGEVEGRIYFRADEPYSKVKSPGYYQAEFVVDPNSFMDLGALSASSLRSFFVYLPYYTGSPVSVEVAPDLWAPAVFQDLIVVCTFGGGCKLNARFRYRTLQRDELASRVEHDIEYAEWMIPWEAVSARVLPLSPQFLSPSALASTQALYLAPEYEPAVPVVVLGFVNEPAEEHTPAEQRAYVVERRLLERKQPVSQLKVYDVPAGLLRTTQASNVATLRGDPSLIYETPGWLKRFEYRLDPSINTSLEFEPAVAALRAKAKASLAAKQIELSSMGAMASNLLPTPKVACHTTVVFASYDPPPPSGLDTNYPSDLD